MIASTEPPLLDQWRRQLGGKRRRRNVLRLFGALGYLTQGPMIEGLIELDKLAIVILHDEPIRPGHHTLHLAGFSAPRVPWGVKWGGAERCRFLKNLLLQPVPNGPGLRLNTASTELLRLGLELDHDLERHVRRPWLPGAAAAPLAVSLGRIQACRRASNYRRWAGIGGILPSHGQVGQSVAAGDSCEYFGLSLYALPWASHHWQQAVVVFAHRRFPRRQVFSLRHPPGDLIGFQGAAEYDFHNTRFRPAGGRLPRPRREPVLSAG